jgi:undecaprenyl-phosphate galactose phosphotransferase/putative colanic acid biosynthesis UDP-glucose lipid carrier transferase
MEISRRTHAGPFSATGAYVGLGLVSGLTFLVCGRGWGLYRLPCLLAPQRHLPRLAAAAAIGALAVVSLLFLLKTGSDYSRGSVVIFALLSPLFAVGERTLLANVLARAIEADIVRGKRVVMIGERAELDRLTSKEIFHFGLDELGRFALSLPSDCDELTPDDKSIVLEAIQFGRKHKAMEFALIMPWSRDRTLSEVIDLLRLSPRALRLYPDHKTRDILLQKRESDFDPYLSVEVRAEPLTRLERLAKRGFDILFSLCALIMLSPVLAVAALLIKLDSPGPVIFRQTRWGFDDREFKIWKFRTMNVMEDGGRIVQAQRDDKRVTAVGRVLRRTSIDELPQLVNVLRGEMSIVGPRPHAVAHDVQYGELIAEYALRRHVKPGLTGLAQVQGLRGETKTPKHMEMRIQKDLWYISNWSFWLDLKIVFQTVFALALNEAY